MNALLDLFTTYLPHLKGIAIVLVLFWGGLSIYYGAKTGWATQQLRHLTDAFLGGFRFKRRTIKAWKGISSHLQTGDSREWKLAIIEADILLGDTLHILGIEGKGTGEKLFNIDDSALPNIKEVWEAHRLRNQIAHEARIDLEHETAQRALRAYEKAFQHLGLIS